MSKNIMQKLIAVVEDEQDILELVSHHLKKARFQVNEFQDAQSLFVSLESGIPDLIVLDLMLPDADGFEICKELKSNEDFSSVPIIVLTARSEETDKILGLELGADDYVTKPFSPRELVARVKAVLRRFDKKHSTKKLEFGDLLRVDVQKYDVSVEGSKVDLTNSEFKILQLLTSKKGWVFSREQILDYLWGNEKYVLDRTVDVHIKHLREKLGVAGKFIKNVRGVGYKFEA